MKYTGPIYRPPIESDTVLLQVTVGCAHNKCTFCTMYKSTAFSIEPIKQIEKDLREAKQTYGSLKRIFLINGDAFVLSARRLKEISAKIIEYFPEMETITMYASVRNIIGKTDEELRALKSARINDLWVGLETGNDDVLSRLNKGYTLQDARTQLTRLNNAGIRHNAILMIGAGGTGTAARSAAESATLINETKPSLVGITPLGLFEGSQLAKDAAQGKFVPATELEILQEERMLIEQITVDNIPFYGDHPLNATRLNGILPQDKQRLMQSIDRMIKDANDTFLHHTAARSSL